MNLKQIREAKGITAQKLAHLMDVSVTQISKWENGKNISVPHLLNAAQALSVTPNDILGVIGEINFDFIPKNELAMNPTSFDSTAETELTLDKVIHFINNAHPWQNAAIKYHVDAIKKDQS